MDNPVADFEHSPPGLLALDNMVFFAEHAKENYIKASRTLLRPSQGFWGTGEQGNLFQVNRGTKAKFWGEQWNKDNIGEQGT